MSSAELHKTERDARYQRFEERIEIPMLIISLLIIPVLLMPVIEDLSPASLRTLEVVGVAIWLAFAVEFAALLYLSADRWQTVRTHKLDLLLVLLPFLRPLRIFRIIRLAHAGTAFARTLRAVKVLGLRPGFASTMATVAALIVLGGGLVAIAENGQPGSTIDSLGDGLWWALVTCTTVGYGDEFPVTGTGRVIAVLLMLAGISGLSVITANVAAFFVSDQAAEQDDSIEARLARIEAQLAVIADDLRS